MADINPKIDLEIANANNNILLTRLSETPYYVIKAALYLIYHPNDYIEAAGYAEHPLTEDEIIIAEALASEMLYSIPDTTKTLLNYATLKAAQVILELMDSHDSKIRLRAASLFLNSFTKSYRNSNDDGGVAPINNNILFVNGGDTSGWGASEQSQRITLEPAKKK